jgi:hypothetical protein
MTPHHEEALRFLRLADRDIDVLRHIGDQQDVHISMVCFHAQQAVEKSLKAVLFERQIDFSRTHSDHSPPHRLSYLRGAALFVLIVVCTLLSILSMRATLARVRETTLPWLGS